MVRYKDRTWQKNMKIRFDFNNMMEEYIGKKQGINKRDIKRLEPKLEETAQTLKDMRKAGDLEWADLPYSQDEVVEEILATANEIKGRFDTFVVLGIGGSALGPIAVQQALSHLRYNELSKKERGGYPRLYVIDNIDPEGMNALFDIIDLEKTVFNVITKSGSTSETMSQFLIVRDLLKAKLGQNYRDHIIATTDKAKGNLIKIAKDEGFKLFYIPDGVGGRFSELCPVGLLPAAVCGIDIRELLAGAAFMDNHCKSSNVFENAPYMAATLQYIALKNGKNISVMMPYADSLKFIADWYAQLWAESLGKEVDRDGKKVHTGQTPVKALGVTDQHSQIQLYAEGPFDKVITFVGVDDYRSKVDIPHGYEDIPAVSFLGGYTLNELIKTEQIATEYALMKAQRPNRTITLPEVNEFTLGQLLYFFEMETAFMGELLNINAFNQPGVEEGKNATYAMMGRPGYEEKKKELDNRPEKKEEYII